MNSWKHLILRNWHLKLFSLLLATMLWGTIASESISEIGMVVPLEYQNIPPQTEVLGDGINTVEVRLRGPSTLLREISIQDISIAVDVSNMERGIEKIVPLVEQHIRSPFGIDLVRVIPARVRLTLESTVSKMLPVSADVGGRPLPGSIVKGVTVHPESVMVEGPASRIRQMETVLTTLVDVSGKFESFELEVELDIVDPLVRVLGPSTVLVRVEIGQEPEQ